MQDKQKPEETQRILGGKTEKNEFTANSGLVSKDNAGVINYTVNNYGREEPEQPLKNSGQDSVAFSEKSPYRGLSPFLEADAAIFFGRSEKIESLYSLVQANPLAAVIGASGSGKSSLVYAGLLPRLRQMEWLIASFRPKLQPFAELATALVKLLKPELDGVYEINQATLLAKTLQEENGFYQSISRLLSKYPNQKIILFVDQFEELFKLNETECKKFIDCLLNTIDKTPGLKLILTLRADFCEQVYAYPSLLSKLQKIESGKLISTDLKLGLMSKSELQEAIECPAKGRAVFEPGLVEQILEDLGTVSGSLPLLEFTLDELWKKGKLTLVAYREIGGVKEALAKRAEAIYAEYERRNKSKQVEKLFRQLVAVSEDTADTRRIVTRSQIKDWDFADELSNKRLLVIGQDEKNREQTVELIHEALIQEWARLRGWVNDKREDSIKFQRIESAAKEWKRSEEIPSDLWQGRRLKDALQLLKKQDEIEQISSLAEEFIKKSETARNSKLIRDVLIGAAAISFVVGITGYFFIQENSRKLKQAALRGETSPEILKAIPDWLQEAESKQTAGKDVEAIAIARENARIMENWRKAVTVNSEQYDQSSMEVFSSKVKEFSRQAEDRQVLLIEQYRLPKLKEELKKGKIGNALPEADLSKSCDQQYTEGALRTTCAIIFRDLGAASDSLVNSHEKADSTPNLIDTQEEADRIPYQILVDIENPWRENTKNRGCGWLGSQEYGLSEPRCKELKGKSLVKEIFASPFNVPIERLEQCKISRVKELQSPQKLVKPKECK